LVIEKESWSSILGKKFLVQCFSGTE